VDGAADVLVSCLVYRHAINPGAEAWSFPGTGARADMGVIVIHGFTGNPVGVRPLAEALAERGYAVALPRLPGHGSHWRDMASTRYADWRGEVERVLDKLAARCQRVLLVGLSLGGTIALDVASSRRNGPVAGVVAINATVLDRPGALARLAPLLAPLLPVVPAAMAGLVKNDIAKPGGDEKAYGWVPTRAANSLLAELPRIRSQLAAIRVPILVAYSPQDHSASPENSKVIPTLVNTEVVLLPLERSYHVATLDYDAELLEQRIAEFAERLSS